MKKLIKILIELFAVIGLSTFIVSSVLVGKNTYHIPKYHSGECLEVNPEAQEKWEEPQLGVYMIILDSGIKHYRAEVMEGMTPMGPISPVIEDVDNNFIEITCPHP